MLKLIKKGDKYWLFEDSEIGLFSPSKFTINLLNNVITIVYENGLKSKNYNVIDCVIYDLGATSPFTTSSGDLFMQKLEELNCPCFQKNENIFNISGGAWGDITGNLSNQTDLQTALDSKLDKVSTAGVERAYIINADGSQGTKATSEFKDVLEFANLAAFPLTGEAGKIYLALDTNFTYRWSGSAYVQIGTFNNEVEQQLQRYWYSVMANTLNTTLLQLNNTNSFTVSGTASIVPRGGTLYYNSIAMNNYLSASTNGSNCGIKNNNQGDGSYLEGFDSSFVFINNDTNVNCETTVGYYGLVSPIPNIDKVNYTTDLVCVGNDVGDTNLSFFCRRNTFGISFVKVDCGSGFPAHTTTDAYLLRMQMSRGYDGSGRTLKMTITNIITGAVFSHTFTDSQIPGSSRNIVMVVNRSNRNTGVVTNIRFSKWHQTKYIY